MQHVHYQHCGIYSMACLCDTAFHGIGWANVYSGNRSSVSLLNAHHQYADFTIQLALLSKVCKSGLTTSNDNCHVLSHSLIALMQSQWRQARLDQDAGFCIVLMNLSSVISQAELLEAQRQMDQDHRRKRNDISEYVEASVSFQHMKKRGEAQKGHQKA